MFDICSFLPSLLCFDWLINGKYIVLTQNIISHFFTHQCELNTGQWPVIVNTFCFWMNARWRPDDPDCVYVGHSQQIFPFQVRPGYTRLDSIFQQCVQIYRFSTRNLYVVHSLHRGENSHLATSARIRSVKTHSWQKFNLPGFIFALSVHQSSFPDTFFFRNTHTP